MMEGSGSVFLTNGSGRGSGRPKTYGSYGSGSPTLVGTFPSSHLIDNNFNASTRLVNDLRVIAPDWPTTSNASTRLVNDLKVIEPDWSTTSMQAPDWSTPSI
jgi:hypothetical protein